MGKFIKSLDELGILSPFVPPGAHSQIGTVEAHNHAWRSIANKTVDACGATTLEQMDLVRLQVNHAKNTNYRVCGRSASMAVFGKPPPLPAAPLSTETASQDAAVPRITPWERYNFTDLLFLGTHLAL